MPTVEVIEVVVVVMKLVIIVELIVVAAIVAVDVVVVEDKDPIKNLKLWKNDEKNSIIISPWFFKKIVKNDT